MEVVIFVFVFLNCFIAAYPQAIGSPPTNPPPNPPPPYEYILALQWPKGVCSNGGCTEGLIIPPIFTIRGYWANDINGNTRTYCPDKYPHFYPHDPALLYWLKFYWPSILGHSNLTLWIHEWRKYGTCSNLPPMDYFFEAMDRYTNVDTSYALVTRFPYMSGVYELQHIQMLFDQTAGQGSIISTILICQRLANGTYVLNEVRFCFTSQKQIKSCSSIEDSSTCRDSLLPDPMKTPVSLV